MPMRESARGHASSRRLPRSQTSRFSLFPPDPSPRLCQYCRPHPFFLHPEAIQDRLFSVFRFCGRRSFLANAKASPSCLAAQLLNTAGFARSQRLLSCPDRTVCFARISRSINLLRRDQFSESCRLRPCFFTILSEARSRHCRFSIIFSPSLSAIFCDAQIALVITHFCRKGTYDRAIADYDQAIKLKPDDAYAYNSRGLAYSKKGLLDRAIADYDQAIRLKPDVALAYFNRGNAHKNAGNKQSAIADFRKSLELPTNPNDRKEALEKLRSLGVKAE